MRLTKRNKQGVAYLALSDNLPREKQVIESPKEVLEGVYAVFQKLAEYEDTGLTPDEIESFKENYEMSRTGVQNLSAKLVKLDEERKYWRNEALKWASELGEQKIERGN